MHRHNEDIESPDEFQVAGNGFIPRRHQTSTGTKPVAGIYKISPWGMREMRFERIEVKTDNITDTKDTAANEVIAEIKRFWTLKEKYKEFGFIHKRGFLLYGPPGTGKTTTCNKIMQQMVADGGVVVIAPHDPEILTGMLQSFRAVNKEVPLLVMMEDIDNLIRYGETDILALLDGGAQIENVVYLATTNHLEHLPARIHNRPSRFDKKIKLGVPSVALRREFFRTHGVSEDQLDTFVDASKGLSVAHLKELIIGSLILGNDPKTEGKRLGASLHEEE